MKIIDRFAKLAQLLRGLRRKGITIAPASVRQSVPLDVLSGRARRRSPKSGGREMARHGERERTRRLRQMGRLS